MNHGSMLAEKARTNASADTAARAKLGLSIVAGAIGGACFICMCAFLLYRRRQRIQQTVFPAAADDTLPEGCCEDETSDDSDLAQSEYSD